MSKYKKPVNTSWEANIHAVLEAYSQKDLARICAMHERNFEQRFNMVKTMVDQKAPSDFYLFRDNGANILAVAHLDTVADHDSRRAHFVDTEAGPVVHSRALDDRLGAYIILDMLPKLGINVDVLLTVGEESGNSTALYFETEKQYNWVIEFDRGGTDVVMYQYDDMDLRQKVRDCGATCGSGAFSDISYMDALKIKCLNWGVGYRDYHGSRSHAYLYDTFLMVCYFIDFHDVNADVHMPHTGRTSYKSSKNKYSRGDGWEEWDKKWDGWEEYKKKHNITGYSKGAYDKYLEEAFGIKPYTPTTVYGLGTPTPVKAAESPGTSLTLYHGLGFDGEDAIDHETVLGSESLEDAEAEGSEHSKKVDDYEGAVAFLAAESTDCDNPYSFNYGQKLG